MPNLLIGTKNFSPCSSMRPWVVLEQAGIPLEEVMVRFDSFERDSKLKDTLRAFTPAGCVPVLVDERFAVWDTFSDAKSLSEKDFLDFEEPYRASR